MLHAAVLSFRHPATEEELRFESPMPDDLRAIIDQLGEPLTGTYPDEFLERYPGLAGDLTAVPSNRLV